MEIALEKMGKIKGKILYFLHIELLNNLNEYIFIY